MSDTAQETRVSERAQRLVDKARGSAAGFERFGNDGMLRQNREYRQNLLDYIATLERQRGVLLDNAQNLLDALTNRRPHSAEEHEAHAGTVCAEIDNLRAAIAQVEEAAE